MTATIPAGRPTLVARADQVFPTLTAAQLRRVAAHGRARHVERGEVLFEAGTANPPFFVVQSGFLEVVRQAHDGEEIVAIFGAAQFTGEINMLAGRPALFRLRAGASGDVVEFDRDGLLMLVQSDGELSEVLMRALILRRVELVASGLGDVVLMG